MERFAVKFLVLIVIQACVCFNFVNSAPKFYINTSCSLPRGNVCIEIRKCPYFAELLNNSNIPRPRHIIRVIREHQCGFYGNVPKVCCTLPKIATTEVPLKEESKKPPDVSNHRNLELLPRSDCGPVLNEYRITSGSASTLLEFPWMALLAYMTSDGLDFRCGGTVINNRYVLTAAHCILNMTLIGVRLGEHNINTEQDCGKISGHCAPPVQDFYVEDVIVHPDYIPSTFNNDIALVRLATPANFSNSNVQPICLPLGEMSDLKLDGKSAVVSGWGVTETGFKSAELLKITIPVVPNEKCRRIYEKYTPITDRQLCAGGFKGRDSCGGDSGGPLKQVGFINGSPRYIQHGIVSYGPRHCGTEGQPGVYTRVSYYLDWILDNMKP